MTEHGEDEEGAKASGFVGDLRDGFRTLGRWGKVVSQWIGFLVIALFVIAALQGGVEAKMGTFFGDIVSMGATFGDHSYGVMLTHNKREK